MPKKQMLERIKIQCQIKGMNMDYNYHTHTVRCSHATGTAESYIERAIECGIKDMGFSDHAPFRYPDGQEDGYRVPVAQARDYVEEISALREKYRGRINIRIGFEMEYYPAYFQDMLAQAVSAGAEYLLLGQHFYNDSRAGKPSTQATTSEEDLDAYVSCVLSAMESGVFTYVAHPDILRFTGEPTLYREKMRKICALSREKGVPLEINFLGIRDSRHYPNDVFWEIAGEEKSPVTFGFDAHDTQNAYDGESLVKANALVRKYGLHYIGKPKIITIR